MENSKKPKIRFKGFTDDWEQRELTSEVELFNGLTYSPNDIEKGGTLVLRSSNVKNGEIIDADNVYVNPAVVNCDNVKQGDIIVVVRNGSRALIGKHAEIKHKMDNTVIGAFMTGLRSENYSFINSLLDTAHFSDEVEKNLGATINQITNGMFEKMEFMFPDKAEQTQIGTFFKTLDNLITLHQRKYEKLVNVKKAMLEKMFPKNGEKTPEIRFKGFTDDWEQRELGGVCKITMGQSPQGENYTNNSDDYILVQGNADMKNGEVVPRVYTTQITKTAEPNDLIMSVRAPVGEVGKTAYNIVIGRGVSAIKGNEFVFQTLKMMKEKDYWDQFSAGSTFDSINSDVLYKATISYPNLKEQAQIGTLFKTLDNLITLHQRKLEKLKNIKKSMLEKMFV